MKKIIEVIVGDVLEQSADILISTANPWLNMSGGVNGAILQAGGLKIQEELKGYLSSKGKAAVEAGTVVKTASGGLPFQFILHAVAIDPFYDSNIDLVRRTLISCFEIVDGSNAKSLSMPALATGYGPLSIKEFAEALNLALKARTTKLESIFVVVRSKEDAEDMRSIFNKRGL